MDKRHKEHQTRGIRDMAERRKGLKKKERKPVVAGSTAERLPHLSQGTNI